MNHKATNETIKSKKKQAFELYHLYGTQIKQCNSESSTPADFIRLTEIKKDWTKLSTEANQLQTLIKNDYKNGKQNHND